MISSGLLFGHLKAVIKDTVLLDTGSSRHTVHLQTPRLAIKVVTK